MAALVLSFWKGYQINWMAPSERRLSLLVRFEEDSALIRGRSLQRRTGNRASACHQLRDRSSYQRVSPSLWRLDFSLSIFSTISLASLSLIPRSSIFRKAV
jgi:hypothetical protein